MTDKETTIIKKLMCWASPGCHDRCGIVAEVKNGKLVKLRGNRKKVKGERLFQSCPDRLPHLIDWLNYPNQLMHPLKRASERGENKWVCTRCLPRLIHG